MEKLLELVKKGKLDKSALKGIFSDLMAGMIIEDIVKVEKVGDNEIEEEVRKIVKEKPGLRPNAYMGLVIAKFKGKIDAKKAMEIIKRVVGD